MCRGGGASGLLSMMLLLVSFAADTGLAERIACGVVFVAMRRARGQLFRTGSRAPSIAAMLPTLLTGAPLGGMLFLQL